MPTIMDSDNLTLDDIGEPTKTDIKVLEDELSSEKQDDKNVGVDEQITSYMKEIREYPLLTQQEEIELAKRIEKGDKEAKDQLIVSNLRLVVSVAKNYNHYDTVTLMDLIQEGNIGLMTAADRFDYRKGYKFSTYAVWWIRQAITRGLSNDSRMIRIPVHYTETLHKIQKKTKEMTNELGRVPNDREVADALGMKEEDIKKSKVYSQGVMSLDTPVRAEQQEDDGSTLADFIQSDRYDGYDDPEKMAMNDAMASALREQCEQRLTDRERTVLYKRYGLDGRPPKTLEEVGKEEGVTRERIRQIEAKALRKLKMPKSAKFLKSFWED